MYILIGMGIRRHFKKLAVIFLVLALFGTAAFALRGPYISNYFKRLLLSEIENTIGRQVTVQQIYVNLFPLFVEAKGIKVFDRDGLRLLSAEGVKGYVSLSGLIARRIDIERIVLKSPEVWTDRTQVKDIIENIKASRSGKKGVVSVKVKAVALKEGKLSFYDEENNAIITASGIDAEIVLREDPEVTVSVGETAVAYRNLPLITGQLKGAAVIGKDSVRLKRLTVTSYGSSLESAGALSGDGGDFSLDLNLLVESLKKLFGLGMPGKGTVKAKGTIKVFKQIMDTTLDLKLKGDFYLETLMELLGAKAERLSGPISLEGELKGKLSDLSAEASARLRDGDIFGVKVDDLNCRVLYSKKILRFKNGKGRLYGGRAQVNAYITLPKVKPYGVDVSFFDVDSPEAFELIKLSWLKLPGGKITGTMKTEGEVFTPEGSASYIAVQSPADALAGGVPGILSRVEAISGKYLLEENVVTLSDFTARTAITNMPFSGVVDLNQGMLGFEGSMETVDVADLSAPYFERLRGPGRIKFTVDGPLDDPRIESKIAISGASLDDFALGNVEGEIAYSKKLLTVKSGRAERAIGEASGTIAFPKAEGIFDLSAPFYSLAASLKDADLAGLFKLFAIDLPVSVGGKVASAMTVTGTGPLVAGPATISEGSIDGVGGLSASLGFTYEYESGVFAVKDALLSKGGQSLSFKGSFSRESFGFAASSERLMLKDFIALKYPVNYAVALDAEGKGAYESPDIRLTALLSEGKLKDKDIGGGVLKASLKDRDALFEAKIFDGKTTLKGKAVLRDEMAWSAELDIGQGRYDFLIGAFIEDVPEDLLLDIEGKASLSGDREHYKVSAVFSRAHMNLFGQGFSNDSDIKMSVADGTIHISDLDLRSGDASFGLSGAIHPKGFLNLVAEGSLSLSPLKTLSKKIDIVKGNADFVLSITGDTKEPLVNGGIDIKDASLALKGFPQRLTAINGYVYVDENRIVIQKLGAQSGGGDIALNGLVQLKGRRIEKIYVDMLVNNVTAGLSKDFTVNFGGNILLRGSSESRYITGEVRINRARYSERVEWKSWLLSRKKAAPQVERGWAEKTGLNLKVYGTDNIIVDNNIARAPLKIDMTLRGTLGSPLLLGRIETAEGKVFFRNREFRIVGATADFVDAQKAGPYIEIQAETSVRGYHIWLNLEGRPQQFDLTLTSDPPADEVQILGLLTVGEFGESLKGLEGGIGAAEATSFLTGKFQDVIEERLRDITGLSRVQIAPYVSKSTGTVSPKISVSKQLLEDKLFVSYSTAVGATSDEIKLEYLLGRNVSLLGERDERGSLGGDIKFRFNFK